MNQGKSRNELCSLFFGCSSVIILLLLVNTVYAGEVITGIDEQARLPFWEVNQQGISLRLVQRLPMQTRAFFLARGFNKQQTEQIAQSCVFQTVFKNTSHKADTNEGPSPLEYNLDEWTIVSSGKSLRMKTREDWAKIWQAEKVSKPVQLAFEWALYPTRQIYQPGDYNWGMSVFGLKPGEKFDLQLVWYQYGKKHHATIKLIQCAEDINPQPEESL